MQPYQRAAEESKIQGEAPFRLAKKGLAIGGALAAGAGSLSRIMPFLSEFIPPGLAIKGLSKIDPRFGKFINTAMENGTNFDEVKDFIKEKAEGSQKAPDQRSIIEQYSPELHQFLTQQIQGGRSPLEAGALAQVSGKFKKEIDKMTKDHKTPFSSILESIFGTGQTTQPQQQAPQQMQGQQQSQPGQGQQALMSILQKINQRLGQ